MNWEWKENAKAGFSMKANAAISSRNSKVNRHQTAAEYTSFSSSHRAFTKIDHILDHKTHFNKFKSRNHIKNTLRPQ